MLPAARPAGTLMVASRSVDAARSVSVDLRTGGSTLPAYELDRDPEGVTAREREVREGLRAGKSQYRVAKDLGISKQRVNEIVRDLRRKGVL